MIIPTEIIIIFFLISFLVYTMPDLLVKFSCSPRGKFLLLVLTVVMTIYNRTAGLLMAMLIIFLFEFNYEFNNGVVYEGFGEVIDTTKEAKSREAVPKKKKDQLAIETLLKPTDGNVEVVAV